MANPALEPLSVAEFLEWSSGDDQRYELHDGFPVAMAPTLPAHQILAASLARHLGEKLDARPPCTVRVEAAIVPSEREDVCYHADLAVTCKAHDPEQRVTLEPVVIVEILSPTTEDYDRKIKLPDYRAIPSVQEIALIDPQRIYCEVHRRLDEDRWLVDLLRDPRATLRLPSLELELPLETLYRNVVVRS